MTEDEFKSKVAKVDSLESENTSLKSKVSTMETEFTSVKDQLKALQNPASPPDKNTPPPPTDFYADPDKAFNERLAPFALHTLKTNAELQSLKAQGRHSREYRLWQKEIDEEIEKHQNLADKGTPGFYDNVVAMVKGRHTDEILEAERKGQSLFSEPASGGHIGGSATDTTYGLSKEQIESATKLGMKPEEFAAQYKEVMRGRGIEVGNA